MPKALKNKKIEKEPKETLLPPAPPEPEFSYELKIPEERVAVLIGEKGKIKKEIESQTKTRLNITKDGEVTLAGSDALLLYTAREIVQAIGRGFNPQIALLLLKTDYSLEIINVKDFAQSKNKIERLKGRVIGQSGKARKEIERLTETFISVYGKTIAIIGEIPGVANAGRAVEMLLQGSRHSSVFAFLEKKKKETSLNSLV